ncbi:MAG TPA: substrate-binding and VWA domain-containing protein [Anaerolineae bacterium]|nr:substrate-binding and VWA domain-containing protein [Anaerolineae bacterium]HQK13924.1 substrate-binding and VWA domain-containing protein [Anaerolineae bacterium]
MNRTRVIFFVIIGITLLIIASASLISLIHKVGQMQQTPPGETPMPTEVPHDTVVLTIASSSTKQAWMESVVANFHAAGKTTKSGKKIVVEVSPVLSGGSMEAILNGTSQPVVWSPGAPSWVEQLNEQWRIRTGKTLMSAACKPVVYTPLGFAMWRPMAEALGWPDKPIGWQTIVELAADPDGWAKYGHPEWGKFRFGHAHPQYANAGLLTMTSFVYGITGKTDTLTPQDVYAPAVETALRTLAQNTSKYGMVTTDLLNLMAKQGPGYIHAVATFESDTIQTNLERSNELRFPLVFIFPAEGTFWGDHPYCILDKAEWVTPEQAEAGAIFLDYLLSPEQQALAIDTRLRPLDTTIPLHAPLSLENGTDPRVTPAMVPALAFPNADTSAAIIDMFLLTKRKATVIIALDISGSMQGEKIRSATEATVSFLKRLHPDDRVAVIVFNHKPLTLAEPARVGDVVEPLSAQINTLIAEGSTALYAAVCQAADMIQAQREADLAANEQRLYGVVLLSDGDDTVGRPSENQMFATCLPSHAEADSFKFFPIAFGDEANTVLLKRIADVTGGTLFTATPASIERIYQSISAEQ